MISHQDFIDVFIYRSHPTAEPSPVNVTFFSFKRLREYEYLHGYELNPGCDEGTYEGLYYCRKCPTGHKCPQRKMAAPELCPTGKFQSKLMQTTCHGCPRGRLCDGDHKTICPFKSYCNGGIENDFKRMNIFINTSHQ